jgi:hypothetical protein
MLEHAIPPVKVKQDLYLEGNEAWILNWHKIDCWLLKGLNEMGKLSLVVRSPCKDLEFLFLEYEAIAITTL